MDEPSWVTVYAICDECKLSAEVCVQDSGAENIIPEIAARLLSAPTGYRVPKSQGSIPRGARGLSKTKAPPSPPLPERGRRQMTGFSDEAWQRTAQLREAIHKLPFNIELAAGTLSRARFQSYIVQDALYLRQYSRALAIAAAKAPDVETLRAFALSALEAVMVEQALHERYMKEFGVDPAKITDAEASPDCFAYTNFLMAAAYHDPWEILVAALLPCFWIYWDVGCVVGRSAALTNPYRAWIDTYADEGFGEAVRTVIAITDRAATAATPAMRAKMLAVFSRSSQYEWLFWDAAYQQRGWPVSV